MKFLDNNIRIVTPPASIEEAVEWIRDGHVKIQLPGTPDREVRTIADSLFRLEKIWLKNYSELAKLHVRSGKQVYIVAGLSHILQLHIRHGWPIMWLTKGHPWTTPENVYRSGMNLTGFLDIIRRM